MSDIATSLISDDEREYLILQKRAISGADDGTYEWALNEIERLREALRKCLPVMRKSHDRIHCLPRTSDTELAEAIDIALGVARTALGEKE